LNVVIDYEGTTAFTAIRFNGIQKPRPAFTHGPGTPIALDAKGHLTLFAVGDNGAVSCDWSGWRGLGGSVTKI
jgi:hypothetical protein